jgi:hypothetical protein
LYALPSVFLIEDHSSPYVASAWATIGSSKNAAMTGASNSNLFNKNQLGCGYIILNLNLLSYSINLE